MIVRPRRFQVKALASAIALANIFTLTACGGGGSGGSASTSSSASIPGAPTPTPTPACTVSNTVTPQGSTAGLTAQSSTLRSGSVERGVPRRTANRETGRLGSLGAQQVSPDLVEVSYNRDQLSEISANLGQAEQGAGALEVRSQLGFPRIGKIVRVLRVNPNDVDGAISRLRNLPAVDSVSRVGYRYASTTTANAPNDPYFNGQTPSGGITGINTPPFYEGPSDPGQWDMHMICASHAWGYAQASGNSFGVTSGVLAGSEKIAIVDTGVDTTHTDLLGKIVHSAIFSTGGHPATCPSGLSMCDKDGHGTDVAGIAAADTNNDYGFAGTAYNAEIIAERVFPDPPAGGCTAGSTSSQCEATTTDIASAINDAVANHANVINLSLGGGSCTNGNDPDPAEGSAISNAIAAGVVVVASSGNGNSSGVGQDTVDAPACDTGVIAVGASAIADGQTNGSGKSGGTPTAAIEYVASYSNYSSTTSNWGLVAPGADPSGDTDTDDLHWIENIFSSTAVPAGSCGTDFYGDLNNCRILIAGTSMASPHVAGVAAMILGAKSGITPAEVFTDLCSGADDIDDSHQGCGRLNAYRSVARAVGDSSVP